MTSRIHISIPKPCHEKWDTMAPDDRGRFCMACQKQVIDFTKASDREIVTALKQNKNLCGRFISTQLNRDIIIRKEKTRITTILALAFSLTTLSSNAQEKKKATQVTHTKTSVKKHKLSPVTITGIVTDSINKPLVNVTVLIKGKPTLTETDSTGTFRVQANIGDILIFDTIGYSTNEILIEDITPIKISLQEDDGAVVTAYGSHKGFITTGAVAVVTAISITQKRSFFGRMFHKIGNLFR